jgi:hypothetical protein
VSGDPNLGSRLEDAIERRAQQAQNRVRDEQTPLKERIDRPHSAKESQDSSSAADDSISKEGPVSSSALDDSIAKESPDSSSACGNNTEELPLMEKSNQSLPLKPLSSRKPNVDWAETSPDTSDEDVNMNKESVEDSSLDHAEINPGFSAGSSVNAIVHESRWLPWRGTMYIVS